MKTGSIASTLFVVSTCEPLVANGAVMSTCRRD